MVLVCSAHLSFAPSPIGLADAFSFTLFAFALFLMVLADARPSALLALAPLPNALSFSRLPPEPPAYRCPLLPEGSSPALVLPEPPMCSDFAQPLSARHFPLSPPRTAPASALVVSPSPSASVPSSAPASSLPLPLLPLPPSARPATPPRPASSATTTPPPIAGTTSSSVSCLSAWRSPLHIPPPSTAALSSDQPRVGQTSTYLLSGSHVRWETDWSSTSSTPAPCRAATGLHLVVGLFLDVAAVIHRLFEYLYQCKTRDR